MLPTLPNACSIYANSDTVRTIFNRPRHKSLEVYQDEKFLNTSDGVPVRDGLLPRWLQEQSGQRGNSKAWDLGCATVQRSATATQSSAQRLFRRSASAHQLFHGRLRLRHAHHAGGL